MSLRKRQPTSVARILALAVSLVLLAGARPAAAGGWGFWDRFWGELDIGGGQLHRSLPGISDDSPRLTLDATFGQRVNQHLFVGVECSGSIALRNLGAYQMGADVGSLFAVAKIYPSKMLPLHLRLGGGTVLAGTEDFYGETRIGTGWEAGIGYDIKVRRIGYITLYGKYWKGKLEGGLSTNSVSAGVGWTMR